MVAKWMSEAPLPPSSAEFKTSYASALKSLRRQKKRDPETVLRDLATLFSEASSQDETTTPRFAERISDYYTELYSHAAPFNPDALVRTWSRCRLGSLTREECAQQVQARAEQTWSIGQDESVDLIEQCMSRQLEGRACRTGSERARRTLEGDLSRSPHTPRRDRSSDL
jgi:hypothetical protein